jgi:hypothetical protein
MVNDRRLAHLSEMVGEREVLFQPQNRDEPRAGSKMTQVVCSRVETPCAQKDSSRPVETEEKTQNLWRFAFLLSRDSHGKL